MRKRWFIPVILLLVLAGLFAWQLPALLRALPSRYVARLPQPLESLGVREHVDRLPTAAAPLNDDDVDRLLAPAVAAAAGDTPSTSPAASHSPPTPTPPPTTGATTEPDDTATVSPPATATPTSTPPPSPTPFPIPPSARLDGIQHRFQDWNNCGPATLAMTLTYFQIYRSQTQTASVLKPDPEDRNVSPHEMAAYVNDQTAAAALDRANGDLTTLRRLVSSGFPVIVEVGIDPPGEYAWMEWYGHYLLVVAYDDASETFWVYDSWFGTSEVPQENADDVGREISYAELERYWSHFNWNYIVAYQPEEADTVAEIIGEEMDDSVMWQNALERVQARLGAEPDNAFLWFNLGTVFNALGDYERAAAAFDRARAIGLPWRMLWYQFGPYEAYYETGRYEEVIVLTDVTLQDRPYFEEAFYYKGLAQLALGDVEAARKNLEKAVDFNPNFEPAAQALQTLASSN